MRKILSKKSIFVISLVLLFAVAAGGSLAYVFTRTDPVENRFAPAGVSCAVVENNGEPVTNAVTDTGNTKEKVKIKNTGDAEAYIRAAVVVNWMNADGTRAWAVSPKDTEYTIIYNLSEGGWFDGGDGFYYYSAPVAPGALTGELIGSASLKSGVTAPTGTDGTQYYLSVEIVASAIQSKPASTVEDRWKVSVTDGKLAKQGG